MFSIVLWLVYSISGCSSKQETDGKITINIRVMNEFRNLDKVLARYSELTRDDPVMSNIRPNFTFVTGGDYKDKLTTAFIGQEDYDLMFCGSWHGLQTFIQQGLFTDLSLYFNNDAYPGLKQAFSPDFVSAMTSYVRQDDGSFKKGIYGVNLASYFEDTRGLFYREDLRKKYNCAPITDDISLMAYLDTVIAGEAKNGTDWLGLNLYNFFRMETPFYSGKAKGVYAQDSTNVIGDQTHFYIGLSPDGKRVLNAVTAGDKAAEFAKMPPGFQYDFITEYVKIRSDKWNKYLSPYRGTGDTEFRAALASYTTLSNYESSVRDGLAQTPEAEYGFYVLEPDQRNMEKGAVICEMVTNNWLVVPEWSTKTDAVMHFLDWMFSTRERHDLFHYGISGEDWIPIGDDSYKPTDIADAKKYVMPTYSLTENPSYIRKSVFAASSDEIEKWYDYMYSVSTYKLSPLAGFAFNSSEVETEIANVTALSNELQLTISKYSSDEAVAKINAWHAEAAKVGLEKIRAELIKQVQAFLDAKNKSATSP
jgi:putative aldouronate transport system substrate-binding protein